MEEHGRACGETIDMMRFGLGEGHRLRNRLMQDIAVEGPIDAGG